MMDFHGLQKRMWRLRQQRKEISELVKNNSNKRRDQTKLFKDNI